VGGAAVAAVSRGDRPISSGVVLAYAAASTAAVVALLVARRLPRSLKRSVAPATQ
jgi:hypothetical protein